MTTSRRAYLPGAGHDWFLPLYDPLLSLLGGDTARRALLDQAAMGSAGRVLDIGCGTGTLAVLVKRLHPNATVVGLDPDPKALARARRKAERADVSVRFDEGYSEDLPYASASFDRVFSSFMLHHLSPEAMEATLREAHRVLEPGGIFHVLDFGRGQDALLALFRQAGFADPRVVGRGRLLLLPLAYYQAAAPSLAGAA